MDKMQKHYAEKKKPDTKEYKLHELICTKVESKQNKNLVAERRIAAWSQEWTGVVNDFKWA